MGLWSGATGSLFLTDEERGKKDDDHKSARKVVVRRGWNPAPVQPRRGFRRLVAILFFGGLIYLFIKYIPTDVPIRDRRRPVYTHPDLSPIDPGKIPKPKPPLRHAPPPRPPSEPPTGSPAVPLDPTPGASTGEASMSGPPPRDYNGPVMFSHLASSLNELGETKGFFSINRNVLFAAASLKSVSQLLPMACQMSAELRSYVHFALMSRSEISIEELKAINGVDDACVVFFHDARPDNSSISSDMRLENGIARALHSINIFMHPQAVVVDGSDAEETYLLRAMRLETPGYNMPLVEMPAGSITRLKWMAKLDSASLQAWNKVNIDILIQAQPGASGSLIRLLKSLGSADYTACAIPHLTIELPQEMDAATEQYLQGFRWPPAHLANPSNARLLSIRHRIHKRRPSMEESTVRFLESYWPTNPADSHVLVLSPQVELSPHFFHYLKYTVLEYRHSNPAIYQEWGARLMGISLELPSTHVDGTEGFKPPARRKTSEPASKDKAPTTHGSFLWQAPNSNAVLYMGDKWVELHGYVSQLLVAQGQWQALPPLLGERLVGRMYPAWLEHAVRLCRARGYWTLYPSAETATNLAVVHTELYQPPEEYSGSGGRSKPPKSAETKLVPTDLLESLPGGGDLPHMTDLPILSWEGTPISPENLWAAAMEYADVLRSATGCTTAEPRNAKPDKLARDLFCDESHGSGIAGSL